MGGLLRTRIGWVALVSLAMTSGAFAQEISSVERQAHALYEQAAADFTNRDFAAAIEKLDRAYAVFPKAIILLKKSEALENLGRLEEALDTLRLVSESDGKLKAKIVAGVRRLEVLLAKPVRVSVLSGEVTGASIVVDGVNTGRLTPSVIEVVRGAHLIEVQKDGYSPFRTEGFVAMGGGSTVVDATLIPLSGHMVIRLDSGTFEDTRVVIDGVDQAMPDVAAAVSPALQIGVGHHEMICIREGFNAVAHPFSLAEGQGVILTCDFGEPMAPGDPKIAARWVGGTGGLVALGGLGLIYSYFRDLDYAARTDHRLISNKQVIGPALLGIGLTTVFAAVAMGPTSTTSQESVIVPVAAPTGDHGLWLGVAVRY